MPLSPRKAYEVSNRCGPFSRFVCRRKPVQQSGGAYLCVICRVIESDPPTPTREAFRARYREVLRHLIRAAHARGVLLTAEERQFAFDGGAT